MGHSKKTWLASGVLFIIVLLPHFGQAFVPESELFPYDTGVATSWSFGDDESRPQDFSVPFNFFNNTYNRTFISGNGQISFGQEIRTYTPSCSPSNTPMIMGYWGDGVSGNVRFYESTNRTLLRKAGRDIFTSFPEFKGISLSWIYVLTWKKIPFFGFGNCGNSHKRNTYQLILATDGTHSFALMYYSKIEWTTGTASSSGGNCLGLGGNPAKAGFDFGDGQTLYTIPGSCTPSILNITQSSNIDQPGKWVFRIDSNLKTAACHEFDGSSQKLRLTPSITSYVGNGPLKLEGPCIKPNASITCVYNDALTGVIKREGVVTANRKSVFCPMPYFNGVGRTAVHLEIRYPKYGQIDSKDEAGPTVSNKTGPAIRDEEELYKGHLFVMNKEMEGDELKIDFAPNKDDNDTLFVEAEWDPAVFHREAEILELIENGENNKDKQPETKPQPLPSRPIRDDTIDLHLDSYNGREWKPEGILKRDIPNTGSFKGLVKKEDVVEILGRQTNFDLISPSMTRSRSPTRSNGKSEGLTLVKATTRALHFGIHLLNLVSAWPGSYANPWVDAAIGAYKLSASVYCEHQKWKQRWDPPPTDTGPCPPNAALAGIDNGFERELGGTQLSVRQKVPSPSGAGSQCSYNKDGNLMQGPPGGGTVDRYSPNYSPGWHNIFDEMPSVICCSIISALNQFDCPSDYYGVRPSKDSSSYRSPRVARAVGDPHITTFDGLVYTFNGVGEFTMVRLVELPKNLTLTVQARMEQYISKERVAKDASVFTAVAMEEVRNGEKVTIQVSYSDEDDSISVSLDGEQIPVEDELLLNQGLTLPHKSAYVTISSRKDVTVTFSSSFSFQYSTVGVNEAALNIIGMADPTLQNSTEGLMGNFDGIMENDFILPDGTLLPLNSSAREIHYDFGMKWMVPEEESIFTYLPGKSYSDYSRPDFTPKFVSTAEIQELPQSIMDTCEGNLECAFDFVTTGSAAIANQTKTTKVEYDHVVEVASHVVKMCPGGDFLQIQDGYATVTNLEVGGLIEFSCKEGFTLPHGPANCTCTDQSGDEEDPTWICSNGNYPKTCVPHGHDTTTTTESVHEEEGLICEPPPVPKYGLVIGTNYSVGSSIQLRCINETFEIFWKNCKFNGEAGLCKEFCNVTYTCMKEEVALPDADGATTETIAVWRGYAGDIDRINCNSKFIGKIATFLRGTALLVHIATEGKLLPASANKKRYLAGC